MKLFGVGKDNLTKHDFSIFFGNKCLVVAYYTRAYKFIPRFYYYRNFTKSSGTTLKICIGLLIR